MLLQEKEIGMGKDEDQAEINQSYNEQLSPIY